MEEKKKHKVMIGIEVVLLCMLVAILGTNAASSNPPSNGVSYRKNNQTTVEGALNDLYNKANYGNASEGQILKGKTALVGGKKVTGTMPIRSGSSQAIHVGANNENTYLVFPYGYYPAENHFSQNNTSEVYIPNSQIASAIGLTANKIVKGQTVLGITGTGETGYSSCSSCCPSCPTLASQTSSATAEQGDILSGKTAYVNGNKITGTMSNKGAVSGTVSPGGAYTIPAGYHNGSGKVTAASCPTCESQGYYKFYRFDKNATYTRTSSGTNTVLHTSQWARLCAENKMCRYTFTIDLDVSVKKIYFCESSLYVVHGPAGSASGDFGRVVYSGFRVTNGSGYRYFTSLGAVSYFDEDSKNRHENRFILANNSSDSIAANGKNVSVSCSVQQNKLTMELYLDTVGLQTYDSSFFINGSIVYQ